MFAQPRAVRNLFFRLAAFFALLTAAACELAVPSAGGGEGPVVDTNAPVQVALLVPAGSSVASDGFLATNLENAARLAIADLQGVSVNLRVYPTAGQPGQAASAARQAVSDGAQIILGPLYAEAANAAGVAVAGDNINLLAFSNNPSIAGGNVFVLGATFQNTANRLVGYANRQGINRYVIVHADDVSGQTGRDAIANAIRANGGSIAGIEAYAFSQEGVQAAAPRIAGTVRASGAQAIFLTAGVNADLPLLATALPDQGISPEAARYIGLTRWDAAPQAAALPGLQGGLFAVPDTGRLAAFESRYQAAYGAPPHPLAGLAYDGMAAIGALLASGNNRALTASALTTRQGFQGTQGVFRLLPNGQNERALAVATFRDNRLTVLEPAPGSFGAGF